MNQSKEDERAERQRMINEFAREMSTTAAVFINNNDKDKDADNNNENDNDDIEDDYGPPISLKSSSENKSSPSTIITSSSSSSSKTTTIIKNDNQQKTKANIYDEFAMKNKIPISQSVDIGGHEKAVTCLSFEPSCMRFITGSLDYNLKMYDFGGMDSRHRSFKSLEVEESHPIVSISHSPSGDRFIVSAGSCQPKVYDREGEELIKFIRGDMYLRDLSNTKGHTMEVTCVNWHPQEKNIVMTSSLDGTLRIWDLTGDQHFNMLVNKHVLKIRATSGGANGRIGATSCTFTPNGNKMIGGASDGTIHIWNEKKIYSKADIVLKAINESEITFVMISKDSTTLVSRSLSGTIMIWDLRRTQNPLKVIDGIPNIYPTANVEFNPDESLICCGTTNPSMKRGDPDKKSLLCFFNVKGNSIDPCMKIVIPGSAIVVKWPAILNQLFVTTSSGYTKVFYDHDISKKGAILTAIKAPKREKNDFAFSSSGGEIIVPNALPMFREESQLKRKIKDMKDPVLNKIPERQLDKGPINNRNNNSFFFQNYVMSGRTIDNSRTEDPREALLKHADTAANDPIFFGRAYSDTQPVTKLHDISFEEEQEQFKKRQKQILEKF